MHYGSGDLIAHRLERGICDNHRRSTADILALMVYDSSARHRRFCKMRHD